MSIILENKTKSDSTSEIENEKTQKKEALAQVIDSCKSMRDDISSGLDKIKEINKKTHSLALNARIEANRAGEDGKSFLIVSNSIDELATKITEAVDNMRKETIQEMTDMTTIIQKQSANIRGNRLANLALTNMDIIDRNLFERTADIRWWATDNILVDALTTKTDESYEEAEKRLQIILKSYTVYHDLILCDMDGNSVSTGMNAQFGLTGQNFSDKEWFQNAQRTMNGTEYGFQTVHFSNTINDHTIAYSSLVHEDGDTQKKPIGILAAVFNWTDLAQRIVSETPLYEQEKKNTRVCLVDDLGTVLADTDKKILRDQISFDEKNSLFGKQKDFVISTIGKKKFIISHGASPGFEGYFSGWHCLIIQPFMDHHIVDNKTSENRNESLEGVIKLTNKLSDETNAAITKIQDINEETHILALNAAIEAARAGNTGKGFGVISEYMGKLSSDTSNITKKMSDTSQDKVADLSEHLVTHAAKVGGEKLSNMAMTNIDLIDRTLYERTADVRWWATDNSVINAIQESSNQSQTFASEKLATILQYYTIYQDIILCDVDGIVIANGNSATREVLGKNLSKSVWFQNAMSTPNGYEFGFETVRKSKTTGKLSVRYSCKVHKDGDVNSEVIGVLGVSFKWGEQLEQIIANTPISSDERKRTRICIVDNNGLVLADSNNMSLDETLSFDQFDKVMSEPKNYHTYTENEKSYCIGHAQSPGYSGYSTGWHSIIKMEHA